MSLGLSDKEQCEWMAKTGHNESAISYGEAAAGAMEAYNFSAGASIMTVHAESVRPSEWGIYFRREEIASRQIQA